MTREEYAEEHYLDQFETLEYIERNSHIRGTCEECGEECESVTIDVGYGPYEYWGARGTDVHLIEVSPCCEGEVR